MTKQQHSAIADSNHFCPIMAHFSYFNSITTHTICFKAIMTQSTDFTHLEKTCNKGQIRYWRTLQTKTLMFLRLMKGYMKSVILHRLRDLIISTNSQFINSIQLQASFIFHSWHLHKTSNRNIFKESSQKCKVDNKSQYTERM